MMMTECSIDLESFLDQYIETALWSSTDRRGNPLDHKYTSDDIHPDTLAKMRADCQAFLDHPNGGRLIEIAEQLQEDGKYVCPTQDRDVASYAAHDFWLTRNGHGAGFFETNDWPKGMGDALQELAESFGTFDLDAYKGVIYGS
jgi:hypothetical protein